MSQQVTVAAVLVLGAQHSFINVLLSIFLRLYLLMYLLLHLYLLTFCHHIIVLQLVPADGISGSGLSSFVIK